MNQKEFFRRYNISLKDYKNANLKWTDLINIRHHYMKIKESLKPAESVVVDTIRKSEKVHSVRGRIKEPDHLIEKIIRKKIIEPNRIYTVENYAKEITDLVGVRALHLYKEDWEIIHEFITETFKIEGKVKANVRRGDSKELKNKYKEKDCDVINHPNNYRSVHYQVITKPLKEEIYVEIQVRTLFEEAWSEIDHQVRYPYVMDINILNKFLDLFNRLSGSADEMGSFVKLLRDEVILYEANFKEKEIQEYKYKIRNLKIGKSEKEELEEAVNKISISSFRDQPQIPGRGRWHWDPEILSMLMGDFDTKHTY